MKTDQRGVMESGLHRIDAGWMPWVGWEGRWDIGALVGGWTVPWAVGTRAHLVPPWPHRRESRKARRERRSTLWTPKQRRETPMLLMSNAGRSKRRR